MRNFVRKIGFGWVILAILPLCTIINQILKSFDIDSIIIVSIILPLLAIQLFSLVIMIVYRKEIWGNF